MATHFSTRELAELLGVPAWKIRRLFEERCLAAPLRIGRNRAIARESIPEVVDALRRRGWLPATSTAELQTI